MNDTEVNARRCRFAHGAHSLRGQESRRRTGSFSRARARRHAGARPPAGRGCTGFGEDADGEDHRQDRSRHVQAHPVHAGPGPGGPRRDAHLQSEDRRVRHVARPGVHAPAAGGRNQPRAGEGAERAARSDAGVPGNDRRQYPSRAGAVPGDGDAEPHRDRGYVSSPGSPGRPLHDEGARRLSERRGGVRHRSARHRCCAGRGAGRDDRTAGCAAA